MEAKDFRAWIEHMGFSDAKATRMLGLGSRNTLAKYKSEGAPVPTLNGKDATPCSPKAGRKAGPGHPVGP